MTKLFERGVNIKFDGNYRRLLFFTDLVTEDEFYLMNDENFDLQKVIETVEKIRTV